MPDARYARPHQVARARWAPLVAAGGVCCWRCGRPIVDGKIRQPYGPGKWRLVSNWHLGHDDIDPTITRGPEHAIRCNLAAAGRKAGRLSRARAPRRRPRVFAPLGRW